jgi:hypothetical protein
MSARKRGRGTGDAGGAVAWEPQAVPSSDEGAAFLGALFGGGASGLQALIRHVHDRRCHALALTPR